jgi:3-oxoadipate enol-lactonase
MNSEDRGRREYRALIGSDPEEGLARVRQQSPDLFDTVIEGSFGGVLTRPELDRASREIAPGSIFRVAPDTPHMMSLERPEAVAEALDAFLPAGSEGAR